MKITFDKIKYKGRYFEKYVCEIPNDHPKMTEKEIFDYVRNKLDELIQKEEQEEKESCS